MTVAFVKKADAADKWKTIEAEVLTSWLPMVAHLRQSCAPPPEVGYEEVDKSGTVLFSAEIAWPEQKIALLSCRPEELPADTGWTLLTWSPNEAFPVLGFGGEA